MKRAFKTHSVDDTRICYCCREQFGTENPAQHCCDDCERGPDDFDKRKERIEDEMNEPQLNETCGGTKANNER